MRLVFLTVLVSAGCGPTIEARAAIVGRLDGDRDRGALVYQRACASCHGANGEGTAGGIALAHHFTRHSIEELAAIVLGGEGLMAGQPSLSNQEVADVLAYGRASIP